MVEKTFLDRAAQYTYAELEKVGGDPSKLDIPKQTVAVLYTVQAIIDNGGYQYLFESDLPFNPPYSDIANAYRRIGSVEAAEKLTKAVEMFSFENPHLHREQRLKFMETLEESSEFIELGNEVCGDEKVWNNLEEYAKRKAASFPIAIN